MPQATYTLSLDGGYNTEAGPLAASRISNDFVVSVPWLIEAQNIVYSADGWIRKMPGASNVNTTATGATDNVMGIFDYWRSTASGDPVQRRVVYAGTQIYSNTPGNATLDSIATGRVADVMPAFEVMNDALIMAETSTTDVPATWDQTTFANLGGSPPNFSFHVQHKDRMWAAGVDSNKSRLFYTVSGSAADWTGAGSGSIDIAPDDGDQITGLAPHKDRLIVLKGPNRGRIVFITGSAPTGSDAFAQVPFIRGVGCTSHQSIIPYRDDLLWWSELGIHSLVATAAFGDYNAAFVSAPIQTFFNDLLNHARFRFVWGQNFVPGGYSMWTVARSGNTDNNVILIWDYRFTPPRFALWPAASVAAVAIVIDTNRQPTPWYGTYTGRVMRGNRSARNFGGVAYTGRALMPYLSFGDPTFDKMLVGARVGVAPKGDTTFTFGWQRDGATQQTEAVNQGGVPTLGASSDQFTLDASTLGGGRHIDRFPTTVSGSFKALQIDLQQTTLDVDFEPHSVGLTLEGAGVGRTAILG